jgi:hypothetical protein
MELNVFTTSSSYKDEEVPTRQESEQEKLQQKLDQTRRLAAVAPDPTTTERLAQMIEELTEKLRTMTRE